MKNNEKRSHSGDQNFDDQGSVRNTKRSGNLTDVSSSDKNTRYDQEPLQAGEDTPGGKNSDQSSNKKTSKN
jgi:hypothetical protein